MADVLIFDDDPEISGLMKEVLEGRGLKVRSFPDGREALAKVREEKPRLLILDLMMPGLDGTSICRQVRSDAQFSGVKVAVVSAKGYPEDRRKALEEARADAFIDKPFPVEEFARRMDGLLSGAASSPPSASAWKVRLWGQGVGCLSVLRGEDLFVLDAGASLERLAADQSYWSPAKRVWLLLTHYHADHVAGLGHAAAWLKAGLSMQAFGPRDNVDPISDRILEDLQGVPEDVRRRVRTAELFEGGLVPDSPLRIEAFSTMHPGATLAFKLEENGRRVVFAPDNELKRGWEEARMGTFEKLAGFSQGADLLVHDSRYTDADYPSFALQGHSSPLASLRLGVRSRAHKLMLYHLDSRYDAGARREIEAGVKAAAAKENGAPECFLAADGWETAL